MSPYAFINLKPAVVAGSVDRSCEGEGVFMDSPPFKEFSFLLDLLMFCPRLVPIHLIYSKDHKGRNQKGLRPVVPLLVTSLPI